jgi:parvulin-like peptidyl-prolyl isomerase
MGIKLLAALLCIYSCLDVCKEQKEKPQRSHKNAKKSDPVNPYTEQKIEQQEQPAGADSLAESNVQVQQQTDELVTIDSIKAVVYGQERTDLVTLSDIDRPSIAGNKQTLDDLVTSKLLIQDAVRYKMEPNDEAVDNNLKAVQRENNLSLDDLKAIFSSSGYSYEEGRAQFKEMTAISTMIDFRIRSRLIIPEREIESYYQAHPIIQEASFQVERALVTAPYRMDRDIFLKELKNLKETGQCKLLDIEWSEPFWINKSEIANDKQFITMMEVSSIAIGSETAAGVELFKLINKKDEHLLSLEERYNEIADYLKRPKYDELFEQYKKDLFNGAAVVYF